MKIKSLGANKTQVEFKDKILLVSYETPVALIQYLGKAIKTSAFHSVTTSKHINQWLRDNFLEPDKIPTVDQPFFDTFLDDNMENDI